MKFLVLGDTHSELKYLNIRSQEHPEGDAILQCGDFGIWSADDFRMMGFLVDKAGHWDMRQTTAPITDITSDRLKLDREVYFITGNHENFDLKDSLEEQGELYRHGLHYIRYDTPVTFAKEGICVGGLSGCYSYRVYTGGYQKRKKIKVKPETPPHIEDRLNRALGRDPRGRFKPEEVEILKKQKVDILLLHEVPMGLSKGGDLAISQKPGTSVINELIEEMQPKVVLIGHMHQWLKGEIGNSKLYGFPSANRGCGILDTDDWSVKQFRDGDDTLEIGY